MGEAEGVGLRRDMLEVTAPLRDSNFDTLMGCSALTALPALFAGMYWGVGFGFWASTGIAVCGTIGLVVVLVVMSDRVDAAAMAQAKALFDSRFPPGTGEAAQALTVIAEMAAAAEDTTARQKLWRLYQALGGDPMKMPPDEIEDPIVKNMVRNSKAYGKEEPPTR